jgi:acyl-CoA reductase-like NAD-dependent aldehyde dehydrogenase
MGPAILSGKTEPSSVRLRLLAADSVSEDPSRSDAGNEVADTVRSQLKTARTSQADWAAVPLPSRLKILKKLRLLIAADPRALANTVDRDNLAETLAAEVLPLLDACRFLETEAARILKEKTVGQRGRPMWLWGNSVVLRPEPLGVVLIIGPSNYPLMLPGIQLLQAIAAGNAVLVKPAANGSRAMQTLVSMAVSAGLPEGLIQVLPESSEAATEAIRIGVDKVFLTGSAQTGRAVSRELAESTTPSVMELSGCDAVFVLEDADLNLVSDCLLFGLTLNNSQTCMAPRRVFANNQQADEILRLLKLKLATRTSESDRQTPVHNEHSVSQPRRIREAISSGAELVCGSVHQRLRSFPARHSGSCHFRHVDHSSRHLCSGAVVHPRGVSRTGSARELKMSVRTQCNSLWITGSLSAVRSSDSRRVRCDQ